MLVPSGRREWRTYKKSTQTSGIIFLFSYSASSCCSRDHHFPWGAYENKHLELKPDMEKSEREPEASLLFILFHAAQLRTLPAYAISWSERPLCESLKTTRDDLTRECWERSARRCSASSRSSPVTLYLIFALLSTRERRRNTIKGR